MEMCIHLKREFLNGEQTLNWCIAKNKDTRYDICFYCPQNSRFKFDKYKFTIQSFSDFSKRYKKPILLEEVGPLHYEIFFFKNDRAIIEKFLFLTTPAHILVDRVEIETNDKIEYSTKNLIEYKNNI